MEIVIQEKRKTMKNLYKVLVLAGAMAFGASSFAEDATPTTTTDANTLETAKVFVSEGKIKIKGAEGAKVIVVNINGQEVSLEEPGKGVKVVIIKKGDNLISKKVIVK